MSFLFSPWGNQQFFDDNGNPAVDWKIHTYVAGSTTALATFTTSVGDVAQTNPIVLNALGFPTNGQIWLSAGRNYKLELTNAAGVVKKTGDVISGVASAGSYSQWLSPGLAPTYVSATVFTLVGDQTVAFHVGRKLRLKVTAGTVYGMIVASVYTTLTTVTLVMDSGALDAGLSSVDIGVLSRNESSAPLVSQLVPKDAAFTVVAAERRHQFDATGTWIMSLTAAAALGSGFTFSVRNSGIGVITVDPAGAELINGLATLAVLPGDSCDLMCNGAAWVTKAMPRTETTKLPTVTVVMSADTLVVAGIGHRLDFRSATLADGTSSAVSAAPANLVIPAGATLGGANGAARYIDILEMNVAGVSEFAVANTVAGGRRAEQGLVTTVAIDAASDLATVFYSTTARTDVPYRIVKRCVAINLDDKWKAPTWVSDITPMSAPRRMVQNLNITTGAVATGTTLIPSDDTIPQITEGDKYMELAITPTNVLSILEITVIVNMAVNVDAVHAIAGFRDAVADSFATMRTYRLAGVSSYMTFSARVVAGSVAATTFTVRAGGQVANTTTFNGVAGGRLLGGSLASSITIKEYLP